MIEPAQDAPIVGGDVSVCGRKTEYIGLLNLRNLVILCSVRRLVGGGGVYPRILGSNQVLSDSLGSEPKTRENNSKPKGTNIKR